MTTIKIYFEGDKTISMTSTYGFVEFITSVFKKRIYVSLTQDGSPALAINTDNILFVKELKNEN